MLHICLQFAEVGKGLWTKFEHKVLFKYTESKTGKHDEN
jgi:hypothetical protein